MCKWDSDTVPLTVGQLTAAALRMNAARRGGGGMPVARWQDSHQPNQTLVFVWIERVHGWRATRGDGAARRKRGGPLRLEAREP